MNKTTTMSSSSSAAMSTSSVMMSETTSAPSTPVADVVFLVECNANLGPHIDTLKNAYIHPALLHFNGGPSMDTGDYGMDRLSTMYSVIPFFANDRLPNPAAFTILPTSSTHKVKSLLEKLNFVGGCAEEESHVTEALALGLQAFDDFEEMRSGTSVQGKAQKFCILVCNSPPYPIPSLFSIKYPGFTAEDLVTKMQERGIFFSVFSPRKIPELYKLFHAGGGDKVVGDFTWDSRHLVLLRGFSLPVQQNPQTDVGAAKKTVNKAGGDNSSLSAPYLNPGGTKPTSNLTNVFPENPNNASGNNASANPSADSSGVNAPVNMPDSTAPTASTPPVPVPENEERIIIWNGTLEWQEKPPKNAPGVLGAPGAKVSKTLMCHASVLQKDKQEINTGDRWPKHLIMQLIPQQLLAPLRKLISRSRTVEFHFAKNDQSSLESLHNVMENGFSGCVHFGNNSQCDIKVLMLLYNKKTRGFIGFIPYDQDGFVRGIHQIITEHKEKHQQRSREQFAESQGSSVVPQGAPRPAPTNWNPNMGGMNQGVAGMAPSIVTNCAPASSVYVMQQHQGQMPQQTVGMMRGGGGGGGPMINMQQNGIRIMQIQQQQQQQQQPGMQSGNQPVQLRSLLMANQHQNPGNGQHQQWMAPTAQSMMRGQMMMGPRGTMGPQGTTMGPQGATMGPQGGMMIGPIRGGNPMGIMNVGGAVLTTQGQQQHQVQQTQQHQVQQQQQQPSQDMWG